VQSISLLTVRLHRLDFYVVLRKLIAELQAFSQCIQETGCDSVQLTASQFITPPPGKERWGRYAVLNLVIRECPQPSMAGSEKKLCNVARSA
jgi:hypothetical protein